MSKVLQNAPREHSAILSTFIKLPFVLVIFEWPLKTDFTVDFSHLYRLILSPSCDIEGWEVASSHRYIEYQQGIIFTDIHRPI